MKYELLYVIPAKYTDAEVEALMEKVKGIVTGAGATVSEMHNLGKRRLAYPISQARHGNYVLVYLEADAAAVGKLNETLRLSIDVLRHLIVQRDPYLTRIPSLVDIEQRPEGEAPRYQQRAAPAPVQQPTAPGQTPISMEELDKKLDEILTEEVR